MQALEILQELRQSSDPPPDSTPEVNFQSTAEPPSGYLPPTTEPEGEAEFRLPIKPKHQGGCMENTLLPVPVELQSIPVVNELAKFFESGQVLPHEHAIEAVMPAMLPATIAVLESWIDLVNDETNYFVEYNDDLGDHLKSGHT